MDPLELLKHELKSFNKNLDKSMDSFQNCDISKELHLEHIKNNLPLIQKYEDAIKKLES